MSLTSILTINSYNALGVRLEHPNVTVTQWIEIQASTLSVVGSSPTRDIGVLKLSVSYLLVNYSKRLYVGPESLGVNDDRFGVTEGEFATLIAMLLMGSWAGDSVAIVSDRDPSHIVREIVNCDPCEYPHLGCDGSCNCVASGKKHWRMDYKAISDSLKRKGCETMERAADFGRKASEFHDVCVFCGHLMSAHKYDLYDAKNCVGCKVKTCDACHYGKKR